MRRRTDAKCLRRLLGILFVITVVQPISLWSDKTDVDEETWRIAVAEVTGDREDGGTAVLVREVLMTEMGKVQYLSLIERARLEDVLEEQRLQLSGVTDSATAVEVGALLNAQLVVLTAVSRSGLSYTLTSRAVDVESGEILTSETVLAANANDLPEAAIRLARLLTNRISDAATSALAVEEDLHTGRSLSERHFYPEMERMLGNRRWEAGEYGKIRDIAYGLSHPVRQQLLVDFEKNNAPSVAALNIIPFAPGSTFVDRNYLPLSFQGLGGLFAIGGLAVADASMFIAGSVGFGIGYVLGFTEPFRDQRKYNETLNQALHLE